MVVVVDGLAASGGYIAALSSEHASHATPRWSARSACCSSFRISPTAQHGRHQVRVGEIIAPQGRAQRLEPTSPEARAALESLVSDTYAWFRDLVRDRRSWTKRISSGSPTAGCSPDDRRSSSSSWMSWAARRPHSPGSPRRRASIPSGSGARFAPAAGFGDLDFIHLATAATLDAVGLSHWPAASRTGRPSRQSKGSTLTGCWPFGTLRPRTEHLGAQRRSPGSPAVDHNDQIRACPADRVTASAPLSARRREHRQRHPQRDHRRDVAWRPRRAAWLRRFLGEEPPGAHRPQSAHRRPRVGGQEIVPFFKTGKEMRERLNRASP